MRGTAIGVVLALVMMAGGTAAAEPSMPMLESLQLGGGQRVSLGGPWLTPDFQVVAPPPAAVAAELVEQSTLREEMARDFVKLLVEDKLRSHRPKK